MSICLAFFLFYPSLFYFLPPKNGILILFFMIFHTKRKVNLTFLLEIQGGNAIIKAYE